MKKILFTLLLISAFLFFNSSSSFAMGTCVQPGTTGCSSDLQCTGGVGGQCNQITSDQCQCVYTDGGQQPGTGNPGSGGTGDPIGSVTTPIGTGIFANNKDGSGLIVLLRAFLTLIFTISGIYAFIRVLLAGLKFMSAGGDPKTIQASWESIWQAMLGVVIVVSSLIIAVILGQILFGDATAILIPKIYPAGG